MLDNRPDYRRFLLPLALLLAAAAALAVDVPIAWAFRCWDKSETISSYLGYFDVFEPFGHGLGVIIVLFILHQLDPSRRWAIPRVIACTLVAGGAADLLKMVIPRIRPNDFNFDGPVWTTFEQFAGSGGQSFPSAHTATAAGLAAALIWLYPQGRLLFTVLTVLVGCQRVISGAHYPSDVLAGAALGCFMTLFVLHIGRLVPLFDRWEERWRAD